MEYYTIIKELELSLNLEVFLWDSKWIKQSAVKQEKVLEDYIFFFDNQVWESLWLSGFVYMITIKTKR